MPLLTRRHESGLVLAEDAMDETRLSRALKQISPDFALQKRQRDEAGGDRVLVYKVVHVPSGAVVFTWMDEQLRPLPLSSGLVEEFKRHLRGERTDLVSAEEHNRRLVETTRRHAEAESAAVVADHRARIDRGQVQVSLAHHNRKPAWAKKHGGRLTR